MHAFRRVLARAPRVAKFAAGGAGVTGFAFATQVSAPAQSATIASLLEQIGTRLDRIEATLGLGKDYSAELAKIAEVKAAQPDNIGIQEFDFDYFNSLSPELQDRMIACARSSFENPDSGMAPMRSSRTTTTCSRRTLTPASAGTTRWVAQRPLPVDLTHCTRAHAPIHRTHALLFAPDSVQRATPLHQG